MGAVLQSALYPLRSLIMFPWQDTGHANSTHPLWRARPVVLHHGCVSKSPGTSRGCHHPTPIVLFICLGYSLGNGIFFKAPPGEPKGQQDWELTDLRNKQLGNQVLQMSSLLHTPENCLEKNLYVTITLPHSPQAIYIFWLATYHLKDIIPQLRNSSD